MAAKNKIIVFPPNAECRKQMAAEAKAKKAADLVDENAPTEVPGPPDA